MNRRELVNAVAAQTGQDPRSVDETIKGFTDVVTAVVAKGEPVAITGFLKLAKVSRPARMGRNPATGEAIKIKASKKVRVTALKAFKDAVMSGKAPAAPAKKATAAKKAAPAKKAPAKKAAPGARPPPRRRRPRRPPAARRTQSTPALEEVGYRSGTPLPRDASGVGFASRSSRRGSCRWRCGGARRRTRRRGGS